MRTTFLLQDGLLNMYAQTGQVIESAAEGNLFLVLSNHKWATLVWRLEEVEGRCSTKFQLRAESGCQWEFIYCLDSWRALPVETIWSQDGICLQIVGSRESLAKNALRFSNNYTFGDLATMAEHCRIPKPRSLSRRDLLRALAHELGGKENF